jgi:predicted TIM-barrel fold metal-dependent hydrolase
MMKYRSSILILSTLFVVVSCAEKSSQDASRGATPAIAQRGLPIIDMHMHARMKNERGPGGAAAARPCNPEPCAQVPAAENPGGSILRGTLAAMDRYNIVLGFVSDRYEDVDTWVKAAPNRFIPSPVISPSEGLPRTIEELRSGYRSGRFKGMGEIATQYFTIAPNDPKLEPYFALAEEFDVPVLIHTAGLGAPVPTFRSSFGRPLLLEEVIVRHPKLRLYFENAGYPFLDEAITLMTQYPQVYADVSTITWIIPKPAFHRYLRGLVDAGLGKRLMFGSDQMEWPEVIGMGIDAVQTAEFLTADQRRDIFYNNAVRFLRFDEKALQVGAAQHAAGAGR